MSIVIAFTNGIAVLIGLPQLKDLLGLTIDKMPGDFFSQLLVLARHLDSVNPAAFGLGLARLATVLLWPKGDSLLQHPVGWRPQAQRWAAHLHGTIVALGLATGAVVLFKLPVETIELGAGQIVPTVQAAVQAALQGAAATA